MHPSSPPSRSRLPLLIVVLVLLSAAGYFGWPYLQRAQQTFTAGACAVATGVARCAV
jgi:predicted negative regulator of RcsB-dependent stress response